MALNIRKPALKKNLVYTVAFDAPGSESYRFLAKMLVSSLARTFFTGDVMVFRNSAAPLFLVERKGVEEFYIETPPLRGKERAEMAWGWKYRVADLIDPTAYDKILFLDADCLALRNIDELLEGNWDIRYQPERQHLMNGDSFNAFFTDDEMERAGRREGANSGTLAVRGSVYHDVMREWGRLDALTPLRGKGFHDQASWNKLLINCAEVEGDREAFPGGGGRTGEMPGPPPEGRDGVRKVSAGSWETVQPAGSLLRRAGSPPYPWRAEPFPAGEIQFPCTLDPYYSHYSKAAITHNIAADTLEKVEFTFGLYMRTFFCDPTGVFFSMLEV